MKILHIIAYSPVRPTFGGALRMHHILRLLAARHDRVVWGSNWPHPIWDGHMPNDGDLMDLVCDWCGDAATLQRVLVDNPAQLYGFK